MDRSKSFVYRFIGYVQLLCFCAVTLLSNFVTVTDAYAAQQPLSKPQNLVASSNKYELALLKGIEINPNNLFDIGFIIDSADTSNVSKAEANKLISYFLAALTMPDQDLWVNLSPYEKDRIMKDDLAKTDLGEVLLEQDYLLKQFSASLTYPETDLGKKFWQSSKNGQDLLNKIWVSPNEVEVFEQENTVYVTKSNLKVETEEDFMAQNTFSKSDSKIDDVRSLLLPEIEQEVNYGENFSSLRQVYSSVILASWFKTKLKDSILKHYFDRSKVDGIDANDIDLKDKIYDSYLKAFKNGVYDYLKKERDLQSNRVVKRHYFSGGINAAVKLNSSAVHNDITKISIAGEAYKGRFTLKDVSSSALGSAVRKGSILSAAVALLMLSACSEDITGIDHWYDGSEDDIVVLNANDTLLVNNQEKYVSEYDDTLDVKRFGEGTSSVNRIAGLTKFIAGTNIVGINHDVWLGDGDTIAVISDAGKAMTLNVQAESMIIVNGVELGVIPHESEIDTFNVISFGRGESQKYLLEQDYSITLIDENEILTTVVLNEGDEIKTESTQTELLTFNNAEYDSLFINGQYVGMLADVYELKAYQHQTTNATSYKASDNFNVKVFAADSTQEIVILKDSLFNLRTYIPEQIEQEITFGNYVRINDTLIGQVRNTDTLNISLTKYIAADSVKYVANDDLELILKYGGSENVVIINAGDVFDITREDAELVTFSVNKYDSLYVDGQYVGMLANTNELEAFVYQTDSTTSYKASESIELNIFSLDSIRTITISRGSNFHFKAYVPEQIEMEISFGDRIRINDTISGQVWSTDTLNISLTKYSAEDSIVYIANEQFELFLNNYGDQKTIVVNQGDVLKITEEVVSVFVNQTITWFEEVNANPSLQNIRNLYEFLKTEPAGNDAYVYLINNKGIEPNDFFLTNSENMVEYIADLINGDDFVTGKQALDLLHEIFYYLEYDDDPNFMKSWIQVFRNSDLIRLQSYGTVNYAGDFYNNLTIERAKMWLEGFSPIDYSYQQYGNEKYSADILYAFNKTVCYSWLLENSPEDNLVNEYYNFIKLYINNGGSDDFFNELGSNANLITKRAYLDSDFASNSELRQWALWYFANDVSSYDDLLFIKDLIEQFDANGLNTNIGFGDTQEYQTVLTAFWIAIAHYNRNVNEDGLTYEQCMELLNTNNPYIQSVVYWTYATSKGPTMAGGDEYVEELLWCKRNLGDLLGASVYVASIGSGKNFLAHDYINSGWMSIQFRLNFYIDATENEFGSYLYKGQSYEINIVTTGHEYPDGIDFDAVKARLDENLRINTNASSALQVNGGINISEFDFADQITSSSINVDLSNVDLSKLTGFTFEITQLEKVAKRNLLAMLS